MGRQSVDVCTIAVNKQLATPLYQQLYRVIREKILQGTLAANTLLPSTRELAVQLGISRNTVITAYEQLVAEGYIESRKASSYQVNGDLPVLRNAGAQARTPANVLLRLSKRHTAIMDGHSTSLLRFTRPRPFRMGAPAFDEFPFPTWKKLLAKHLVAPQHELLMFSNTEGLPALRKAIAHYISQARGVNCEAEQIVIFSGAQQALSVLATLLADPGETVWAENPGYLAGRRAFENAGLKIHPVAVDEEGMSIGSASSKLKTPRILYVTPSHQYPLGMTMTITRRLEILEFARQRRCWVIEDDYNSEFRYSGSPIRALQGLDHNRSVIYVGTFSKILFPAIRIGFAVLPKELVAPAVFIRSIQGTHSCTLEHAALADFISGGHLARHIRRMRRLYGQRRRMLSEYLVRHLPKGWSVRESQAGMHLVLECEATERWLDLAISTKANKMGIEVSALSRYFAAHPRNGLILGFAGFSERTLITGAMELLRLLSS